MKKFTNSEFLFWLVTILFILPTPILARTAVHPNAQPPEEENQIQRDREKAILEALSLVEPSLVAEHVIQGQVTATDDVRIDQEVEALRAARKTRFKHLSAGHIEKVVTPDAVMAKEEFLQARQK